MGENMNDRSTMERIISLSSNGFGVQRTTVPLSESSQNTTMEHGPIRTAGSTSKFTPQKIPPPNSQTTDELTIGHYNMCPVGVPSQTLEDSYQNPSGSRPLQTVCPNPHLAFGSDTSPSLPPPPPLSVRTGQEISGSSTFESVHFCSAPRFGTASAPTVFNPEFSPLPMIRTTERTVFNGANTPPIPGHQASMMIRPSLEPIMPEQLGEDSIEAKKFFSRSDWQPSIASEDGELTIERAPSSSDDESSAVEEERPNTPPFIPVNIGRRPFFDRLNQEDTEPEPVNEEGPVEEVPVQQPQAIVPPQPNGVPANPEKSGRQPVLPEWVKRFPCPIPDDLLARLRTNSYNARYNTISLFAVFTYLVEHYPRLMRSGGEFALDEMAEAPQQLRESVCAMVLARWILNHPGKYLGKSRVVKGHIPFISNVSGARCSLPSISSRLASITELDSTSKDDCSGSLHPDTSIGPVQTTTPTPEMKIQSASTTSNVSYRSSTDETMGTPINSLLQKTHQPHQGVARQTPHTPLSGTDGSSSSPFVVTPMVANTISAATISGMDSSEHSHL